MLSYYGNNNNYYDNSIATLLLNTDANDDRILIESFGKIIMS